MFKPDIYCIKPAVLIFVCFILSGCGTVNLPNAQQMIVNLSANYPALWQLTSAAAYLAGLAFIAKAIYALKQYGYGMSMMSSQASIKAPLVYFAVGAALMFLPTVKASLLLSSFGYGQQLPLAYDSPGQILDAQTIYALLGLVQLVGIVAFVRGWIMLAHSANPGAQSQFGKAVTHIAGGILAINIQGSINVFQATFGIT